MRRPFRDRAEAGRVLAEELSDHAGRSDVIVLALAPRRRAGRLRGGTGVGAPLDVFLVRKLGAPGHEELAMGAIASGDIVVRNDEVVKAMRIREDEIREAIATERGELARREAIYRENRPPVNVRGKVVILIDDGLATGSSMRAAVTALRLQDPARIVVAVPIGAASTCSELRTLADDCICAVTPDPFRAVGLWYEDFSQTEDDEVARLLARAGGGSDGPERSDGGGREDHS